MIKAGAKKVAVMLVHGMPDDGSCWKYQVPALLNAGYRVIVPDTLGYGKTDRPVEVEHVQGRKYHRHMFEIIDKLKLKDINLVGHDWGSAIPWAMIYAATGAVPRAILLHVSWPLVLCV